MRPPMSLCLRLKKMFLILKFLFLFESGNMTGASMSILTELLVNGHFDNKSTNLYLITLVTHSMLPFFEVNGDATEASAFDNEIPE
jgi:hypothetical protein